MDGRGDATGGISSAQPVKAGGYHLRVIGKVLRRHAHGQVNNIFSAQIRHSKLAAAQGQRLVVFQEGIAFFDMKIAGAARVSASVSAIFFIKICALARQSSSMVRKVPSIFTSLGMTLVEPPVEFIFPESDYRRHDGVGPAADDLLQRNNEMGSNEDRGQ